MWEFRNKDGSQDKRVKDNYQTATYQSEWKCKQCEGVTVVRHFLDRKPSRKVKPARITLETKGSGERKGKDWTSKKIVAVDPHSEHRKGDE